MATSYFRILQYEKGFSKTIYLFGGWRFGHVVYKPLIRFFHKLGYNCVLYVPLSSRLVAVGTPYTEIVAATHWAVADMQSRQPTAEDVVCGISLGTIFAMASVKACQNIQKCLLFSPFGDFSEHVELWPAHHYFSKVLSSQPTDQKESGDVLNRAGLHKDLGNLTGKQLLICYSLQDTVIHTSATKRLVAMLQAAGLNVKVQTARGGHLYGIIRNMQTLASKHKGFFS